MNKKFFKGMVLFLLIIVSIFNSNLGYEPIYAAKKSKENESIRYVEIPYADGAVAGRNKKLIKKLKKNAWSSEPNPESEKMSHGYALYKIYKAIVQTGYLDSIEYNDTWHPTIDKREKDEIDNKIEMIADNKKQKKAIKWLLKNSIYTSNDVFYSVDDNNNLITTAFDKNRNITRWEIAMIFFGVITEIFPLVLEPIDTKTSWKKMYLYNIQGNEIVDYEFRYFEPFYKGIIVGENLNLDADATKEDLNRAIKNFKLIVENRILPVYREKDVVVDHNYLENELNELIDYFSDHGINVYDHQNWYSFSYGSSQISGMALEDDCWQYISVDFTFGYLHDSMWFINGREVDVLETIKKILRIRNFYLNYDFAEG